jgi:hypothetical protein
MQEQAKMKPTGVVETAGMDHFSWQFHAARSTSKIDMRVSLSVSSLSTVQSQIVMLHN